MSRLIIAITAFCRILANRKFAEQVHRLFANGVESSESDLPSSRSTAAAVATPIGAKSAAGKAAEVRAAGASRSDAVTLLATLQREARLVDLVQESLESYSDAQVGAASRDVLRDCRKVLEQSFAIQPVADDPEGSPLELSAGYDPGVHRLVGNISGPGPFRGTLVHRGWKITHCRLPTWTGSPAAASVLATAELEVA